MSFLDLALRYLDNGFSVIPISPATDKQYEKQPLVKWQDFQSRRPTMGEVTEWWTKWPKAMIGAVTGAISNLMAVDGDTEEAVAQLESFLPDSFVTPVTKSPRGKHFLFTYHPGVRNYSRNEGAVKFHIRGEGGYIIMPPSVRDNGLKYEWQVSIEEVRLAPAPEALIKAILGSQGNGAGNPYSQFKNSGGSGEEFFVEGRRDNDLFHLANLLVKGGGEPPFIRKVLGMAARSCNPPESEEKIQQKIRSALERAARRERNMAAEVQELVSAQDGIFDIAPLQWDLEIRSVEEKANLRKIISRMINEGIITKATERSGSYRKVESTPVIMDYLKAPTEEFPLRLPLGVHNLCKVYPGNIIVIAGSKSAGKTAFMLNIVMENMRLMGRTAGDILYMNSEMGDAELKIRLQLFKELALEAWRFTAISRGEKWADLITPENKIFIIDYMEILDNFWLVGKEIAAIHKRLKDGVCIIGIQKNPGRELARGGSFSLDKARLYLSLDSGILKIVDAKAWRDPKVNPKGLVKAFKLVQGNVFMGETDWQEDERKVEGEKHGRRFF